MRRADPKNAYRSVQATTCDPGQLLLLLHDKTLGEIQKAILLVQGPDPHAVQVGQCLVKAHLGVMELDKTLNFTHLPELAESLHRLYLHLLLLLGEGMTEQRLDSLERAHRILSDLRRTWEQAVRGSSEEKAG